MNLLAIVGSPRKGKATDILVDKAIEGSLKGNPDCTVRNLYLSDYDIRFCTNCLVCRDTKTDAPVSACTIHGGMDRIKEDVLESDALIVGTPVHMGYPPALMMAFLERICWTFAKPEAEEPFVEGCPVPRSDKKRRAVIIVTSGIVPPLIRKLCDAATPLIKRTIQDSLNPKTIDDMYAGDIEHKGGSRYDAKAIILGNKLTRGSAVHS